MSRTFNAGEVEKAGTWDYKLHISIRIQPIVAETVLWF